MSTVLLIVALALVTTALGAVFSEKLSAGFSARRNRKRFARVSEPERVEELTQTAEKVVMIRTMAASGGQTGGGPEQPSFESFVVTKAGEIIDLFIGIDRLDVERRTKEFARKLGVPFQDTSYGVLDPVLVTENFESVGGLTLDEGARGELSMVALDGALSESTLSGENADRDSAEVDTETIAKREDIEA